MAGMRAYGGPNMAVVLQNEWFPSDAIEALLASNSSHGRFLGVCSCYGNSNPSRETLQLTEGGPAPERHNPGPPPAPERHNLGPHPIQPGTTSSSRETQPGTTLNQRYNPGPPPAPERHNPGPPPAPERHNPGPPSQPEIQPGTTSSSREIQPGTTCRSRGIPIGSPHSRETPASRECRLPVSRSSQPSSIDARQHRHLSCCSREIYPRLLVSRSRRSPDITPPGERGGGHFQLAVVGDRIPTERTTRNRKYSNYPRHGGQDRGAVSNRYTRWATGTNGHPFLPTRNPDYRQAEYHGVHLPHQAEGPDSNSSLKSMMNIENANGIANEGSFYQSLDLDETGEVNLEDFCHQPDKKRRLMADQVELLEKNFALDNKLEPERKIRLAKDLGLQPRQIAIWFQNRRARWKTKRMEKDYEALKSSYDVLKADYENLLSEKEKLKAEVLFLTDKLWEKGDFETHKIKNPPLMQKQDMASVFEERTRYACSSV